MEMANHSCVVLLLYCYYQDMQYRGTLSVLKRANAQYNCYQRKYFIRSFSYNYVYCRLRVQLSLTFDLVSIRKHVFNSILQNGNTNMGLLELQNS